MNIHLKVAAIACTGMIVHALSANGPRDSWGQDNRVKEIAASEVGKSVQIIGRLGRPLGQLVTIRGQWRDVRAKHDTEFIVESIDGNKTARAIEFVDWDVSPVLSRNGKATGKSTDKWEWKFDWHGPLPSPIEADGEVWELIGVETGGFMDYTEEAWKEIGARGAGRGYGFLTRFEYIAMRRIPVRK